MISPISHLFGKLISLFELKNLPGIYNQEVLASPSEGEKIFQSSKNQKGIGNLPPVLLPILYALIEDSAVQSALQSCS